MTEPPEGGHRPRVLALVGTRPEVIKMAPVLQALRERSDVDAVLALSGQHTDLVQQALDVFSLDLAHDLETEYDLALMRPGQDLYDLAHGLLDGLRKMLEVERPDILLVQGDTATVFFGSLVAFFEGRSVGHVEAGLRSGEKWAPFPEEIFRRLTDVVTDHLFAPTPEAARNLLREGYPAEAIHVTGNTVVDAVRAAAEEGREPRCPELRRILASDRALVLLTAHRRESFGEPIRRVFRAVRRLADAAGGAEILYPVHPNPQVQEPARELLAAHPRIHLVEPLDYLDLVAALRGARLVLTDSGGIQEEAPAFGTPVLVLRDVTERPEAISAGVARLVGTDGDRIFTEALKLLESDEAHAAMALASNPFGDGRAGERIADILVSSLTGAERITRDWDGPDSRARPRPVDRTPS